MGDGLLFFIPESDMNGETPLILFNSLCEIINSTEAYLRHVKIGAAYCNDAYDITFIKNAPDIYGKDIDLTARLASLACSKEIRHNYKNQGLLKGHNYFFVSVLEYRED